MKATVYAGRNSVEVQTVPDPKILNDRDAIVRITSTAICGSDLHLYDGYIPTVKRGDVFGHEFMGEVVEVGKAVTKLSVGDRVVVPFPIACGACSACQRDLYSLCENSNPNAGIAEKFMGHSPAGLFGYSHMLGGFAGGQAEYARVPFADVGPLKIEDDLTDDQVLFLSDILPTGYMGAEMCDIKPTDVVAVWGAGPVGLFAVVSAYLLGAGAAFAPVAATVIVQALLDFTSLALVATVAVGFYPVLAPVVLPVTLPLLGTMALLAAPPLHGWLAAGPPTRWLKRHERWERLVSAFQLLGPRPTAVGLLLGIPTVLVGGLALYLAGVAIRLPRWDVVQAEGVYALSQLLGGISPLPQGLGVTEASGTALLGYLGLDPAEALAAIVLYRAAVLGFSAVLGLLGFLQLRLDRDSPR